MKKQTTIGFSTGSLYKTKVKPISKECFELIANTGSKAIELNCIDPNNLYELLKIKDNDLKKFDYISLHAPAIKMFYQDNQKTKKVLDLISEINKRLDLKCIIIHPDRVIDWKIFLKYKLPLAIENMDKRKKTGKTDQSLNGFFKKTNFKMILDINHCFTVDRSMRLTKRLIEKFQNKICQIHISGYLKNKSHYPLYITKQKNLIDPIRNRNWPIIIESVLSNPQELKKEYRFAKSKFLL
tara:strand:- start:523 stop:1242 length:720 start_codon:yes stop_codon:yes gene_type:complete